MRDATNSEIPLITVDSDMIKLVNTGTSKTDLDDNHKPKYYSENSCHVYSCGTNWQRVSKHTQFSYWTFSILTVHIYTCANDLHDSKLDEDSRHHTPLQMGNTFDTHWINNQKYEVGGYSDIAADPELKPFLLRERTLHQAGGS